VQRLQDPSVSVNVLALLKAVELQAMLVKVRQLGFKVAVDRSDVINNLLAAKALNLDVSKRR
jgi:hypothetical protein